MKYKIESEKDAYRHGDVFLARVDLEELAKVDREEFFTVKKDDNALTIQHGELTGHHHTLKPSSEEKDTQIQVLVQRDKPDQQYIEIKNGSALLTHQEHHPIEIPEGVYVQIQERRFDPFSGMIERVRDWLIELFQI